MLPGRQPGNFEMNAMPHVTNINKCIHAHKDMSTLI